MNEHPVSSCSRWKLPAAAFAVALSITGLTACSTDKASAPTDAVDSASTHSDLPSAPASSSNAGLTPLGDANKEAKTQRPEKSESIVTGVRVGHHETFDRVVFDIEGSGNPGWFVDYTSSPTQQASGKPIQVRGKTALNVNIDGTLLPFELGKQDPRIGTVQGVGNITEVKAAGTVEGRSQFVIGLDAEHPYSVQIVPNPTRIVIDIRSQS
ncbi:hypothetical protein AN398_02160 [Corynebacterium pseudotuberculosis]|uniref:AMIN-like domain-containing (lipo)protein n=1 Tax=Corynebacterium pseudotuberculosis TaxID=1719 RepID=UPI000737B26C|nr:hypothetical protein [Corynebacterium pseudotuberculosis]ALU21014.1 hypothetical protein AN398_02160 [Corynebacterium pseudotuberculosis]ANH23208.1 Hypothetical protein CpE55_0454 [Corynebacterium pseudotuberculosis]